MMKLRIRRLTLELWPALEELFGEKGACNGCWCMYWRIGSAYRKTPREKNKAALQKVVRRGPPPGLIAFDGDLPVGWCQLTPRDALPWLERSWRLKRVDDLPVWSISCLYVRKGYRRMGITSSLIAAAVRLAKKAGARSLSPGCEFDTQRIVDRVCLNFRARRLQNCWPTRATSPDYGFELKRL